MEIGFVGGPRFEVRERVGAGAMGVVYAALDRERASEVAVKHLRRATPSALLRFKREFRALADVTHRNLCTLHELHEVDDVWFFTMELVRGVDIYRHVRPAGEPLLVGSAGDSRVATCARAASTLADYAGTDDTAVMPVRPGATSTRGDERRLAPPLSPEQLERLERSLVELVHGVQAIHAASQLHRDLKPSNVLVEPSGRVVVLDFGVATALHGERSEAEHIVGTPAYMAPEQAAGEATTVAADWYAVGALLFEILTGDVPFVGSRERIMAVKQVSSAPRPGQIVPGVPERLDRLCADLLQRDPGKRPGGAEILARMATPAQVSVPPIRGSVSAGELIGREGPRLLLREAFAAVQRGEPRTVLVAGDSGVGKTALMSSVADELAAEDPRALVLVGRCYERESMRYKAVDGVIDALATHLDGLPEEERAALIPPGAGALSTLFPVLRGLVGSAPSADLDAYVRREDAFGELREVLSRLARARTVAIAIDDVQWGDIDSAHLLSHVLRRPAAPPLLLIAAYRSEDADSSEFLRAFTAAARADASLNLEPLSRDDASHLAMRLLARSGALARTVSEAVARESGGNPFFVQELVHSLQLSEQAGERVSLGGTVSLDEVVDRRLASMDTDARRLLAAVAVAGRPIAQRAAAEAAVVEADEQVALAALRNANLIRTRGAHRDDDIECYHDRIREAALRRLGPEDAAAMHVRIGEALERQGDADPELLWFHYLRGGAAERAGRYAVQAAEMAGEALAFDREVALYRSAIALLEARDGSAGARLRGSLGTALLHAGRCVEAGAAFLEAAAYATDDAALDYRRLAAQAYLSGGNIDEGVATLESVLEDVGLSMPQTPRQAIWQVLRARARIRLRGLRFKPRKRADVPPRLLQQAAACWTAAVGFSYTDHIKGAAFQSRHLLLALRSGEPTAVARALALEANYATSRGARGRARAERIASMAEALAGQVGDPVLHAYPVAARGLMAYQMGDWRATYDACATAEDTLRRHANTHWESVVTQLHQTWSLFYLGDMRGFGQRVRSLVADAEARGDVHSVTCLTTGNNNATWLIDDDIEGARRVARDAVARWSHRGWYMQHYWSMVARTNIAIYAAEGDVGWRHLETDWPRMKRSYLLGIPVIAFTAYHLRGRAALAAAATADARRRARLLAVAERDARTLADMSAFPPAQALARAQRAAVIAMRGDPEGAIAELDAAEHGLSGCGMLAHCAAVRRQRGVLVGGADGAELVSAADRWLADAGVANPPRLAAMLAPG